MNTNKSPRMTIRVSQGSLAFAIAEKDNAEQLAYRPYTIKSGVSVAANLREAFKTESEMLTCTPRARVLVNSPVLLLPIEEYDEKQCETLYMHSFPNIEGCAMMSNVLPDLNAVALFAVNKDLMTVVYDHYEDVKFLALMQPVWRYMHKRSFIGIHRKLFAHFHDNVLELFSFERNRFVFSNRFDVKHTKDALYFILFVWKELALDQQKDELYLSGDILEREKLLPDLQQHLRKVSAINPAADFNRAPMTAIKGITLDIVTMYLG
ncbi:MAG: DUF3822 family protein [Prevotella sp.]|nr:DUF3822 family protein [Prevotella sp.]